MNFSKPLAVAALSLAMLAPTATASSLKMPPELVGRTFGDEGEVMENGLSHEDSFCKVVKVTKKFDRSIPAATKTPLGVWVYTISFLCAGEGAYDQGQRQTHKMYVSKGVLFMDGKAQ
jgi:hypothetical protein